MLFVLFLLVGNWLNLIIKNGPLKICFFVKNAFGSLRPISGFLADIARFCKSNYTNTPFFLLFLYIAQSKTTRRSKYNKRLCTLR